MKSILLICFSLLMFASPIMAEEANIVEYYSKSLNIEENEVKELIDYSKKNKVDFSLVYHLLSVETGGTFKHETVGPQTKYGRAYGIDQFMENTAPWIARLAGLEYNSKEDLFDPVYSIKLCITYLNFLQYGKGEHEGYNDWHSTLTAYNRGMYGLQTYIKDKGTPVSTYSKNVLEKKG